LAATLKPVTAPVSLSPAYRNSSSVGTRTSTCAREIELAPPTSPVANGEPGTAVRVPLPGSMVKTATSWVPASLAKSRFPEITIRFAA